MKNKFRQGLSPRGEKENKGSTEETFGKGLAPGGGRKEGEEDVTLQVIFELVVKLHDPRRM